MACHDTIPQSLRFWSTLTNRKPSINPAKYVSMQVRTGISADVFVHVIFQCYTIYIVFKTDKIFLTSRIVHRLILPFHMCNEGITDKDLRGKHKRFHRNNDLWNETRFENLSVWATFSLFAIERVKHKQLIKYNNLKNFLLPYCEKLIVLST